jgi:CBS domain-containing protein
VLHGGDLVGVLSDREVASFEALPGSSLLTVEEAMVPDVYVTSGDAPLEAVAAEMARRRVGSAIVVESAGRRRRLHRRRRPARAGRRPQVTAAGKRSVKHVRPGRDWTRTLPP